MGDHQPHGLEDRSARKSDSAWRSRSNPSSVYSWKRTPWAGSLQPQFMREEALFVAPGIQRVIEFREIPTQSLVRPGRWKCSSLCARRRAWYEALRLPAQPAEHKERMLAACVPLLRRICERGSVDRVIVTQNVKRCGLVP